MHIKRFNLEIEKAYAIGLTAIHIHSFPYLLEEFIVYLANLHTSFLCNLIYPTFSRILLYSC